MNVLQEIQRLQFDDAEAAAELLRAFIQDVFRVKVTEAVLRPLAVSLNSFNGFVTLADGRRLFFKSHVEPDSVIQEYYNSDLLLQAGYPVIRPVMASTEPGKQMLLYEVVEDQSVFDAAWAIERGQGGEAAALTAAQQACDETLAGIYENTLTWQTAEDHAAAPVHQLFHHRLTRGRLESFYGSGTSVKLPGVGRLALEDVRRAHWTINGVAFQDRLEDVIARAKALLEPAQTGPAVVGHGDAHNGNVFMRQEGLVYFDPAFAGRHDPLLDLVKPLYHNVHAMWMYFPAVVADERGASLRGDADHFEVTFPVELPAIREMFWQSKTERVLIPLLRTLQARGWLRSDWRAFLQAGLGCCPLLTMNLADGKRFPPGIALLGLAHVIEMGGRSAEGSSRVERWLDDVEAAL